MKSPVIRVKLSSRPYRALNFDCEARAIGYGDPNWVPQEITAIAWSWLDSEDVECRLRIDAGGAHRMLLDFRRAYDQAEFVVGHYIRKFDLPLMNAEMLRHDHRPLGAKLTQDTHGDIVRTKGMKRDQENLAKQFGLSEKKFHMAWHDWEDAYKEPGWPLVKERVVSDVVQNKMLRLEQLRRGWLKKPRMWSS